MAGSNIESVLLLLIIFILNLNKNTPPTYKKIKKEKTLEEDTQKKNMDENDDNMDVIDDNCATDDATENY